MSSSTNFLVYCFLIFGAQVVTGLIIVLPTIFATAVAISAKLAKHLTSILSFFMSCGKDLIKPMLMMRYTPLTNFTKYKNRKWQTKFTGKHVKLHTFSVDFYFLFCSEFSFQCIKFFLNGFLFMLRTKKSSTKKERRWSISTKTVLLFKKSCSKNKTQKTRFSLYF